MCFDGEIRVSEDRSTKEIDFLILQKELQDIMSDSAEKHVATERKKTRRPIGRQFYEIHFLLIKSKRYTRPEQIRSQQHLESMGVLISY